MIWRLPYAEVLLHRRKLPGMIPGMSHTEHTANVLTSARMAAGMTSRARRPYPHHPAG